MEFISLGHLKENYKNAKCYKETAEWLEPLFINCDFDFLTDVNLYFIKEINSRLGIHTEIRLSSEFELAEEKTQRLVNICKDLNITDYYSGPAAKAYMDIYKFELQHINVHYWDYSNYKVYGQLHGAFEHGVSVIDLIFNTGKVCNQLN